MKKSSDFFFRKKNKKNENFLQRIRININYQKKKIKIDVIISQKKIIYERIRDNA